MNTPCPTPTGYVATVCANHPAFHPSGLAHTGLDLTYPLIAALLVLMVGAALLGMLRLRRKDAR